MPLKIIRPKRTSRAHSIGWFAAAWMEHFLVHGAGDVVGMDVELIDDQVEFLVDLYALAPPGEPDEGRRLVDEALLLLPKGSDKSGFASRVLIFEAIGPSRFLAWAQGGEIYRDPWGMGFEYTYEPGEPMGRPVSNPFIRCLATSEDQSSNTYESILYNFREGRLSKVLNRADDAGLTRINIPGGGMIVPSTAADSSKDGGRESAANSDECACVTTPVATPDGWKRLGDVQVGDVVFGSDGQPTNVIKVTPAQYGRKCYRVTFEDGHSITVSDGHMWLTDYTLSVKRRGNTERVRTTQEMVTDGGKFSVPRPGAWVLPEVELDIDPYILGLWLGDGDARAATISSGNGDISDTMDQIRARGYTAKSISSHGTTGRISVSLPGSHRNRHSPVRGLKVRLRDAGLLGNKHIPSEYMRASLNQRLELLRGLMDSDGWCSKEERAYVCFVNSNRKLIEQFEELVRSVGEDPRTRFQADSRSRVGGYWKVSFTVRRSNVFSLPRKKELCNPSANTFRSNWLRISDITEVDSVPVMCIGVDADDHLFQLGESCKVTHNTHLYRLPAQKNMYRVVMRNLRKRAKVAEPFMFSTSTWFNPTEDSICQELWEKGKLIEQGKTKQDRLLVHYRYGEIEPEDLGDDEKLKKALADAYGGATLWMDLDALVAEVQDVKTPIEESYRYFLNSPSWAIASWIAPFEWQACGPTAFNDDPSDEGTYFPTPDPIAPGDVITLGFDGSRKRQRGVTDSTALVGVRIRDGAAFPIEIWEQPPGYHGTDGWEAPVADVEERINYAFRTYRVVGFYADPAHWESRVAEWEAKRGSSLQVKASASSPCSWWMGVVPKKTVRAIDDLEHAILNRELKHFGDPVLSSHIINCRRKESASGRQLAKETPSSPRKIDGAIALILAWQARLDAVSKGLATQKKRTAYRLR